MEQILLNIVSIKQHLSYAMIFKKIARYYYMNSDDILQAYDLEHRLLLDKKTELDRIYIENGNNIDIENEINILDIKINNTRNKYIKMCEYVGN